jgi:hypothetical protein
MKGTRAPSTPIDSRSFHRSPGEGRFVIVGVCHRHGQHDSCDDPKREDPPLAAPGFPGLHSLRARRNVRTASVNAMAIMHWIFQKPREDWLSFA